MARMFLAEKRHVRLPELQGLEINTFRLQRGCEFNIAGIKPFLARGELPAQMLLMIRKIGRFLSGRRRADIYTACGF